jgi:hypothetical protein
MAASTLKSFIQIRNFHNTRQPSTEENNTFAPNGVATVKRKDDGKDESTDEDEDEDEDLMDEKELTRILDDFYMETASANCNIGDGHEVLIGKHFNLSLLDTNIYSARQQQEAETADDQDWDVADLSASLNLDNFFNK